ncbi:aspartyl/asparaginyl beta-hydroxylase domain-containing protein [Achromobacter denitrificans]|uniref:aspartyl/asparaginyl beta-hydroxylase domain-containing protein n=1 Tax=Achromobacter denitrificans TaxID=32002 RepID=UPI000B48ED43|nr:aspartyl/asparaginyl beta-hydroxylase domain-containing protein [Achromobacter denitrificans]
MKHFHFLASGLDVNPLMLAIRRQPQLWKEDTFLRKYPQGPFGQTETIMIRFPEKVEGLTDEQIEAYKANQLAGHDQYEAVNYPAQSALPEVRSLMFDLMTRVRGERLGRVMINKVAPGGRIFPHADTPEQTRYYTRFHIVLHGLPGAVLRCGEDSDMEEIQMRTGDCFWFANDKVHEVINNSADDRVSMVVDIRLPRQG